MIVTFLNQSLIVACLEMGSCGLLLIHSAFQTPPQLLRVKFVTEYFWMWLETFGENVLDMGHEKSGNFIFKIS